MTPPITTRSTVCAVVPHFRCEQFLAQAIESLLDQTRPLDAIVVVDDGSWAPPTDVVGSHPEVTLLAAADNGGPYRLVQAVIDGTDYDAYLFQDADDWSAPDRLERLLAECERTGAELVGSHEVRVLAREGDVVKVRYPLDVNAALLEQPTAYPLLHPTSIIGRDLVARLGGFATGMRFSGDAELLRRAAHVARVVNVDHFGYFRRKRPGSLTLGSGTELGSPARAAVQDELARRAEANAALASAGRSPDLRPLATADPPRLRHVAGPALGARLARVPRPRRSQGEREVAPIFVLGAPRSGEAALALALGQHPALRLLDDARWLGRVASDIEARAREDAVPTPPALRAAAASMIVELVGGTGFVARGADLLAAAHALDALLPDCRFVHVVRDPATAVAAIVDAPTVDGVFVGDADDALRSWCSATERGLEIERAFGGDRAARVSWDELCDAPEAALGRCLDLVGLELDRACLRPLVELRRVDAPAPPFAADLRSWADALVRSAFGPRPRALATEDDRRVLRGRFERERDGCGAGATLVERMRELVIGATPEGATVAIVSRGDPRLVDLRGRRGWHLPQDDAGVYAGHHPADGADAVDHLEKLRERGARFLAVPASSMWWLSHYAELRRHLDASATVVAYDRRVGLVYELCSHAIVLDADRPQAPRLAVVERAREREVSA